MALGESMRLHWSPANLATAASAAASTPPPASFCAAVYGSGTRGSVHIMLEAAGAGACADVRYGFGCPELVLSGLWGVYG